MEKILISVHIVIINQASLPDFWRAIALRLWPAYYDPEVGHCKGFFSFVPHIHPHLANLDRLNGCALHLVRILKITF